MKWYTTKVQVGGGQSGRHYNVCSRSTLPILIPQPDNGLINEKQDRSNKLDNTTGRFGSFECEVETL